MSDLISRSEAIKLLRKNMSNDIQDQIITENNINLIESLPTAFDTEKVVEQLEQYANGKICNMHRNCPHKDNDNIACENCGALGAIDIVKKGGVE